MATLWAISDLHIGHVGNKPVTESLHPSSPDDWLIVAGDVAERIEDIRWTLDVLNVAPSLKNEPEKLMETLPAVGNVI